MLNICLASQSPRSTLLPRPAHTRFFEFATAKKHKAEQKEEQQAADKGKTVSAKLFNIFFAWAATVSHKEAGSPSRQHKQPVAPKSAAARCVYLNSARTQERIAAGATNGGENIINVAKATVRNSTVKYPSSKLKKQITDPIPQSLLEMSTNFKRSATLFFKCRITQEIKT